MTPNQDFAPRKKIQMPGNSTTTLSQKEYERCLDQTVGFLKANPSIRNSKLREITGIEYDQAIFFFNKAIKDGVLVRKGHSGGTHYTLSGTENPED